MTSSRALRTRRSLAAVAVAAAAAFAACAPQPAPVLPGAPAPLLPATVRVGDLESHAGAVRQVPIEEYVLASILTEVAPAKADPAAVERLFEVQAIVARTYAAANPGRHAARGFDLCATTHCQLVDLRRPETSSWRAQAERAVSRTAGVVLVHQGRPIQALFHADCGGHTSAATDVWGGTPRPYLRAMRDDLPTGASHQTWRFEAGTRDLLTALNRDARTSVGRRLSAIEISQRDAAGRILQIRLRGGRDTTVRAEDFRTAVTREFGVRSLRSAWFDVARTRDRFVFEGRGFGHGVGLCQLGVQARVALGASALSVLALYYPGTQARAARPVQGRVPPRSFVGPERPR